MVVITGNNIIIKEVPSKLTTGRVAPEQLNGEVVDAGDSISIRLRVGSTVVCFRRNADPIVLNGEEYWVIQDTSIIAYEL